MRKYSFKDQFWRAMINISQTLNVFIGFIPFIFNRGYGDEDETICSVLGKRLEKGNVCFIERMLINVLDWIDKLHVEKSIEEDEGI